MIVCEITALSSYKLKKITALSTYKLKKCEEAYVLI